MILLNSIALLVVMFYTYWRLANASKTVLYYDVAFPTQN
jgi:hypothetical protein